MNAKTATGRTCSRFSEDEAAYLRGFISYEASAMVQPQ